MPFLKSRQPGSEVDTADTVDAVEFADDTEAGAQEEGEDIDITQPVALSSIEQRYRHQLPQRHTLK